MKDFIASLNKTLSSFCIQTFVLLSISEPKFPKNSKPPSRSYVTDNESWRKMANFFKFVIRNLS